MREPYLEITFRHGLPLAAYYYLPREPGQKSSHTRRIEPGLVVDFDQSDHAIGIEITAPTKITLSEFNAVLSQLGQSPINERDFAPLRAA
jgi:uncharacterized protein YuzE